LEITNVAYDTSAFDWKQIFLTPSEEADSQKFAQKLAKAEKLSKKYGDDKHLWMADMVEHTRNEFADISGERNTPENLDRIDAVAETIFDKVNRTVNIYDPTKMMFDVKKGKLGTTLEAHEIIGGKVYNHSYGGLKKISALVHKTYTISSKPSSVHFKLALEELQTGRYTIPDLVFAASQAILAHKTRLGFDTYVTAYPTSATGYVTNANNADITTTVLNGAIDAIADRDIDTITVIGRFSKLTPITDFTGYSDKTLDEIRMKGGIGTYRGANIVKIKFYQNERYTDVVPFLTTSVLAVSNVKNFNRWVQVTPLKRSAWIDPNDGTFHFMITFEDGAAVWKLPYGHRIYNT